jgi:hypothetical protein
VARAAATAVATAVATAAATAATAVGMAVVGMAMATAAAATAVAMVEVLAPRHPHHQHCLFRSFSTLRSPTSLASMSGFRWSRSLAGSMTRIVRALAAVPRQAPPAVPAHLPAKPARARRGPPAVPAHLAPVPGS